eukprot:TRINITY_DN7491_c0_g1_i4.p1 TRINITY_DN7491_c0_g1~~TRINITY_DN7491_c0_g1_i4.p1  ORF type:complete len:1027 (+),score=177.70 TRINITY_DN7491_c0_g1_i4:243-3083(+)
MVLVEVLSADSAVAGQELGASVAMSPDTLLVGGTTGRFVDAPAAFSGPRGGLAVAAGDRLGPLEKLPLALASSGGGGGAASASSVGVAVSDLTALVGEPGPWDRSRAGSARVLQRGGTSGSSWKVEAELAAADGGAPGDLFGKSVAISGTRALVGAPGRNASRGAAFVFERRSGGGWVLEALLTAANGQPGDNFGHSVALDDDTAIIGSPFAVYGSTGSRRGAAYVFARSRGAGAAWGLQAVLLGSDSILGDEFGHSVAVSGNAAIVGTVRHRAGSGAVYTFARSYASVATSAPTAAPTAVSGVSAEEDDEDGNATWNGTEVPLGPASWTETGKLMAGGDGALFGTAVAVYNGTAIIGAPGSGVAGTAFIFVSGSSGWEREASLGGGKSGDQFGYSVGIASGAFIVGAPGGGAVNRSGWAYTFTWDTCASFCKGRGLLKDTAPTRCSSPACTWEVCCTDAGRCSDFSCGPSRKTRLDAPGFCAGATCKVEECCSDFDTCRPEHCGAGLRLKPASSLPARCGTILCSQIECCDLVDSCSSVTCSTGRVPLSPKPAECFTRSCGEADCCAEAVQCTSAVCSSGRGLMQKPPGQCRASPCEDAECCAPLAQCTAELCPAGTALIEPSVGRCAGTACTQEECCEDVVTCSAADCGPRFVLLAAPPPRCNMKTACTEPECCEARGVCALHQCRDGMRLSTDADVYCLKPVCRDFECCESSVACEASQCLEGFVLRDTPANCANRTCTHEDCCVRAGTCSIDVCQADAGFEPRPSLEARRCSGAVCTPEECCDRVAADKVPLSWLMGGIGLCIFIVILAIGCCTVWRIRLKARRRRAAAAAEAAAIAAAQKRPAWLEDDDEDHVYVGAGFNEAALYRHGASGFDPSAAARADEAGGFDVSSAAMAVAAGRGIGAGAGGGGNVYAGSWKAQRQGGLRAAAATAGAATPRTMDA